MINNVYKLNEDKTNYEDKTTGLCLSNRLERITMSLRSPEPFVSQDAFITASHASVTSRIDYCNSR